MTRADDALMLANLDAYVDPDLDRAFRYRPFACASARHAECDGGRPAARRDRSPIRRASDALSALRVRFVGLRPVPAACCAPACC